MILNFFYQYFKKLYLKTKSVDKIFDDIYKNNGWGSTVSTSGPGSDFIQTKEISKKLPGLIKKYKIHKLLDAPCGDYGWLSKINLGVNKYIGYDIVNKIVSKNKIKYGEENTIFSIKNIIIDPLPKVDLILCRDCLVHFSNKDVARTLKNFKESGSKYLLTTTFSDRITNKNIPTGDWRPINLMKEPFNLQKPILLINEKCTEGNGEFGDKCLGMWKIEDIVSF